jgi:hypothetical protein
MTYKVWNPDPDVKTMDKTYYKTSMQQLSRNMKMEERIGFLYSEEHEFLGVQVNS